VVLGPLLFALAFGPGLAVAAGVADVAVRRWVRPLRLPHRAALWAAVFVVGTLAILGVRALVEPTS
jgi:hypothetical protein